MWFHWCPGTLLLSLLGEDKEVHSTLLFSQSYMHPFIYLLNKHVLRTFLCARLCTKPLREKGVLRQNNFIGRVKGDRKSGWKLWPIGREVSRGLKRSLGTEQLKVSLGFPDTENIHDLTKIIDTIEIRDWPKSKPGMSFWQHHEPNTVRIQALERNTWI